MQTTMASDPRQASRAELQMVTWDLATKQRGSVSERRGSEGGRTSRKVILHSGLGEVEPDLRFGDLGVVDGDLGVLVAEVLDDGDGGALAGISSAAVIVSSASKSPERGTDALLLERESENSNLLARDGVEEGGDDALTEATLLVFVHGDDLAPVIGDLGKVERLGEVDEVEDILLEARSCVRTASAPQHGREKERKDTPPKPTEALRKREPIRVSSPHAYETSPMSAPVTSQMAERALMDEMR